MNDLANFADTVITLFRQHTPWLLDKAGAALVAIPIREAWELIKGKLLTPGGQEAIEKATSEPGKDRNWDTLKNYLLDALEQDAAFRERLERLQGTAVNQTAIGRGIKQSAIINSPGASIKM
jgi:hypothetical protein